ncbi:hypothetical protein TNCV_3442981 [Trichonephila clavipes]|nr:hypothetical protein TNCV_3442981 [Trichonephila clavipes]
MKEVAEEIRKRAAVKENSSSPDNLLTVSGDGTWKARGHSSFIGVCTVIGPEIGKVLDREVLSSFCKGCDSYKEVKFGIKYNKWQKERIRFHVEKITLALLKFGLKNNRNVCLSLAERNNRRIFNSRQRRLASSFEALRAKKTKKTKTIELFQEQEGIFYDPGAF